MNHEPEKGKTCGQVGHIITVTLVVRCRHNEAVTVSTRTYIDHDDDTFPILFEEQREFGPFDTYTEMHSAVTLLSAQAVTANLLYDPDD